MKFQLVALNAQFFHTNLAVRSIKACCRAQNIEDVDFCEYTINQRPEWIVEQLFNQAADVYVFSCYIWNIEMVMRIAADLHKVMPDACLAAAGPQVTYRSAAFLRENPVFDAVLTGEGEAVNPTWFNALKNKAGFENCPGLVWRQGKAIVENPAAAAVGMDSLPFPYAAEEDLFGRILYYESMRGCPFGCSYCLSSVERGVRFKSLSIVKRELERFLTAVPKQVKFVDRTFNCNKTHAMEIWRFLQEKDNGTTNFHFEMAGELLDEEMISFLSGVRPGLFQFEIGVQSTHAPTLKAINRPANLPSLFNKVEALQKAGNIHLHLDLIAGLPFEDYPSFVHSFNEVYAQNPHQLQLGFLKVLSGSEMEQRAEEYGIVYSAAAPYEVLRTNWLTYREICALGHAAHMVELYYNSGRFAYSVKEAVLRFETPFEFYKLLAEHYYTQGYGNAPLSKIGHYELLGLFLQQHSGITPKTQWLCKLDLALHEKIKKLPLWVTVDESSKWQKEILDFYSDEEIMEQYLPAYLGRPPKQVRNMVHIEVFPLNPFTGKQEQCALLFDYSQRDITGRAKMTDITFWFK